MRPYSVWDEVQERQPLGLRLVDDRYETPDLLLNLNGWITGAVVVKPTVAEVQVYVDNFVRLSLDDETTAGNMLLRIAPSALVRTPTEWVVLHLSKVVFLTNR